MIEVKKQKLLKLQHDYEKGLISEKNMTVEQISGIEELYIEQIKKLREDFNSYKSKAISLKKRIALN